MLKDLVKCVKCGLFMNINDNDISCECGYSLVFKDNVLIMNLETGYAESFGEQWTQFSTTQIDSINGSSLSEQRFFSETGWSKEELKDAVVLDLGCGSGRFTEIASRFAKFVIAVDLSSSVFAFPPEISSQKNILRIHGDMRHLPINFSKITHVFSIGVLQHTPNPYKTIEYILGPLEAETKFAFTAYGKRWYTKFQAKYLWRFLTKRISRKKLLKIIRFIVTHLYVPLLALTSLSILEKPIKFILPFSIYPELKDKLPKDQLLEFMILDTLDALTPVFDNPLSLETSLEIVGQYPVKLMFTSKIPLIITGVRK